MIGSFMGVVVTIVSPHPVMSLSASSSVQDRSGNTLFQTLKKRFQTAKSTFPDLFLVFPLGRLLQIQGQSPDLLVHFHKIELIPSLDDLAVFDLDDGHSGEFDRRVARRDADAFAAV